MKNADRKPTYGNHNNIINEIFEAAGILGVLMTDGDGAVIYVDDNFESSYGINADLLLNRSVFDLENEGYFKPSSAAIVLRTGGEVTKIQTIKNGQHVIVSAVPIFDDKKISKVVTFTRDINRHIEIKNLYEELTNKISKYDKVMDELSYETVLIENFYTNNGELQKTLKALQNTAKYNINILLLGETGCGKTLLAKRIHELSHYKSGKFIEVNCGALNENLIESELFGYEKGSFTGADSNGKKGLFEIAKGGTIFLDEISEMPLSSQKKLLTVLNDNAVRRVGGNRNIKIDCRVLSASNKDLGKEVENGHFRQDLYYRLNTVTFTLPPLRERREDIVLLTNLLMKKANMKFNFEKSISKEVIKSFLNYDWPGNIRELENVIYRMAVISEDNIITMAHLPKEIAVIQDIKQSVSFDMQDVTDLQFIMEQYEGEIIRNAYLKYGSSIKVANALNISQATANRKIRKYVAV